MHNCNRLDDFPQNDKPVVVAIGFFDGLHLGHQQVINTALSQAENLNAACWLMSFNPHPAKVLRPNSAPKLILTPEQKQGLLCDMGLSGWIQTPFNRDFSLLSPEAFIDLIKSSIPELKHICVGPNWRFGHQAAGDTQKLTELASLQGISVTICSAVETTDEIISSTRVRQAILDGAIKRANDMLGRAYSLTGPVVHGKKQGREMGFPTANIAIKNELIPGPGIYVGYTMIDGIKVGGVGYTGHYSDPANPVQGSLFEIFLLDFEGDLYGKTLEIHFLDKIREDTPIPVGEDLKEQINKDVAKAREILAARP